MSLGLFPIADLPDTPPEDPVVEERIWVSPMSTEDTESVIEIILTAPSSESLSEDESDYSDASESETVSDATPMSPQELHMPGSPLPLHIPTPKGYVILLYRVFVDMMVS
jgi:hypothetical protein